ncbi:acetate--CoA ligase family protein [Allopusillimonas ginsengisoli]|uniref:acetate--CoA ligase family protein n=1 Tax=Allopusillimonas ginsengisoli TaxID=453575 RepID=UPI0014321863|nr:acetate--CoA ligase family protein [Allopusillimonas ginsengisoli]
MTEIMYQRRTPLTQGLNRADTSAAQNVSKLLRPKSIAIVGASQNDSSFGYRLMSVLALQGYQGTLVGINAKYDEVAGLPCYPSLGAMPFTPDCVAFAISDEKIMAAMEDAAAVGVPAAVMFGRLFDTRTGVESLPERVASLAAEAGIRICGANCMGYMNFSERIVMSANPPPLIDHPGNIGLLSHSGSSWSGLVGNQRQLGFNYAVSMGQELTTGIADYIEFLLAQPTTRVIGCVLETVRDPDRFLMALEAAEQAAIPIVVLKLGRSEQGKRFALAHSGALAGSDSVFNAVCERHNVIRTRTLDELADTLELLASARRPQPGALGAVTDSGGERQLIVDIGADLGVPLATLSPKTHEQLENVLDPGMSPENPVDSFGDGRNLMYECLKYVSGDHAVSIAALATNLVYGRDRYLEASTQAAIRVHQSTDKPVVVISNLHSSVSRPHASRLRAQGIPVLMGTVTALLAIKHAIKWQEAANVVKQQPNTKPLELSRELLEEIQENEDRALSSKTSWNLLQEVGLPFANSKFVESKEEALEAAVQVGLPIVLKTAEPHVLHKTDAGGVALNLKTREEVLEAYEAIAERCGPRIQVQKQIMPGVEILLGMTRDPQFGPAITLAMGGIFTEILRDSITFLPPVSSERVRSYLTQLKGYPVLNGVRGGERSNIEALCNLVSTFSQMCVLDELAFKEIDLNPIILGPVDVTIVDSLFILNG